eukprot:scaffold161_cov89-Isochrysis_galbana.AAC.1
MTSACSTSPAWRKWSFRVCHEVCHDRLPTYTRVPATTAPPPPRPRPPRPPPPPPPKPMRDRPAGLEHKHPVADTSTNFLFWLLFS